MNIKPLAQGSGTPAGSEINSGPSASPDKVARAKAIAGGTSVTELPKEVDPQVDRAQNSLKKIKMRTQRSVYRDPESGQFKPAEEPLTEGDPIKQELAPDVGQITTESNITDNTDEANTGLGDTKPISPQFAALAKAKRALQEKERDLLAREEALKSAPSVSSDHIDRAKFKANPLAVLEEQGFSRDQIAEMLLSDNQEQNPAVSRLEAKIQKLEEALQNQNKSMTDRDSAQKQQVLQQMAREADGIIAQGDEYEMVRETNSRSDVIRLIEKTFDDTGEVLDVREALQLIEDELIEESLKIARIKKVQSRLTPAQTEQLSQEKNQVRPMRTLTNRDGASVPSSARERAINAFYGRKT